VQIEFSAQPPASADADLVVVGIGDSPAVAALDLALGGRIARLVASGELKSEPGSTLLLHLAGEIAAPRLVLAGFGSSAEASAEALRTAGAAVAQAAPSVGGTIAFALEPSLPLDLETQAAALAEGFVLGAHELNLWKSEPKPARAVERLVLLAGDARAAAAAARTVKIAGWVNRARELVAAPPNELTPKGIVDQAADVAASLATVTCETLDAGELALRGFGGIVAVGRGSANEPRLATLWHRPDDAVAGVRLALVGKAVTFDSGGYFLKPSASIITQKTDMAGGAAALAALGAIAELGIPVETLAVIPAAENVLSGSAFRPGDVVTTLAGKRIEITNPDAEGRLLLADALTHARSLGATHIVDLATLTGAIVQALGDLFAGVFAGDDDWRSLLVAAGEATGDRLWPMPLDPRYRKVVESDLADLKNSPGTGRALPIFAAYFLHEFAGDGPWAHIDIAGTARLDAARDYYRSGPSGFGVRLLVETATRLGASRPTAVEA
jgi:leucyl aminopeptidase